MKAGRELDALIAKHVMGYYDVHVLDESDERDRDIASQCRQFGIGWLVYSSRADLRIHSYAVVPGYSTEDIADCDDVAVWQLVDKLPYFALRRLAPNLWQCQSAWCGDPLDHMTDSCDCVFAEANTAPLAICLAALEWARR